MFDDIKIMQVTAKENRRGNELKAQQHELIETYHCKATGHQERRSSATMDAYKPLDSLYYSYFKPVNSFAENNNS